MDDSGLANGARGTKIDSFLLLKPPLKSLVFATSRATSNVQGAVFSTKVCRPQTFAELFIKNVVTAILAHPVIFRHITTLYSTLSPSISYFCL